MANIPANGEAIVISGSGNFVGGFAGFTVLQEATFEGLKTGNSRKLAGAATTSSFTISSESLSPYIFPVGSGSFNVNGINFAITGSPTPTNTSTTIYVPSGSTPSDTVMNITSSFNASSSTAPYDTFLSNISASSLDSNTSLYFYSLDSGSIYNFYYVILQGVKYNFGGGEDAFGSLVIPSGTTVPLLVTSASISAGSVLFYL